MLVDRADDIPCDCTEHFSFSGDSPRSLSRTTTSTRLGGRRCGSRSQARRHEGAFEICVARPYSQPSKVKAEFHLPSKWLNQRIAASPSLRVTSSTVLE